MSTWPVLSLALVVGLGGKPPKLLSDKWSEVDSNGAGVFDLKSDGTLIYSFSEGKREGSWKGSCILEGQHTLKFTVKQVMVVAGTDEHRTHKWKAGSGTYRFHVNVVAGHLTSESQTMIWTTLRKRKAQSGCTDNPVHPD